MELGGADALGVTLRTMDMSAGEHKAPAFLSARPRFCTFCVLRWLRRTHRAARQVNPFGKLPALSDGSVHVVRLPCRTAPFAVASCAAC